MRTQVGIIGAGPAGLMLARLLHLQGISSIIIENRSRDYIENRIRAGLIEHWAADLLVELGVGDRLKREGLLHWGINIGINGELHHLDFKALVDKRVTIYGQQEVVKDLVVRRLADGGPLLFEVDDVSVHDVESNQPTIRFTHEGKAQTIECDFIAGCDGFHGICRPSFPANKLKIFERDYPFGWVGILTESPPPDHELIYSYTDRGFACNATTTTTSRTGPMRVSGMSCTSGSAVRASLKRARCCKRASRRCAASSPNRCSMAGFCSPATARISCRRPAPRA
jgi:p-hydroxybenzoate 3-monooxygenase